MTETPFVTQKQANCIYHNEPCDRTSTLTSETQKASQLAAAANSRLTYFSKAPVLEVHHYVGDENIELNKTVILYEHNDLYCIVCEGRQDVKDLSLACMKGSWIPKSKVGGYFVVEWEAGPSSEAGSQKVHSLAIQQLREDIIDIIKADKMKIEAGLITTEQFMFVLTVWLHQITSNASREAVFNKRDEKLEAEQLAEEFTDYGRFVEGKNKGGGVVDAARRLCLKSERSRGKGEKNIRRDMLRETGPNVAYLLSAFGIEIVWF
ncbi:hypothetical protein K458DRAFT_387595 [Lentithecium fluviatile CBS 122367]|uniref:Uncharacterized protein n=1 Tax=Lentithecium fluviatile CBS 122367 TaxID=1168545 RepID=A0A6G1J617_9PLEO|nr:hypothetical protein K458DRAFT_387595 [Lentithecium fluviatile CBS 122367]